MRRSEPAIMNVVRFPTRSMRRPANGARIIEEKMMMLVTPPAVLKMWRKLLKTWARKLPAASAARTIPHLVWKKSVDRLWKGKMAA